MIKNISIENFKSIKNLNFEARRVNIFIGEPNTGKSNILEALGLFGFGDISSSNLHYFVRFKNLNDIFFDSKSDEILIEFNNEYVRFFEANNKLNGFKNNLERTFDEKIIINEKGTCLNHQINAVNEDGENNVAVGYYKFDAERINVYEEVGYEYLSTPNGSNLFDIILKNEELRIIIGEIVAQKGFELNLSTRNKEIEFVKERKNNISVSIPLYNLSDTLQRVIFYLAAMLSNKNSALIFEEPESHIFPFYNQYLAETIGLDEESGNQYFIATHNPYFLGSIAQKTKIEDLAVFITYMENHETKLRQLREDEYPELFDFDIFCNLDRFIEA